jgi:hypothetical protein
MKRFLLGLFLSLSASAALAQGCGPTNPNCVVPTRPVGDSTNAAASTAFVQNQIAAGTTLVNSITNADGTLTISPTTGSVVASLALTHANTWTALQTFNAGAVINQPVNTLGQALLINQTPSGTTTPPFEINTIQILNDKVNVGTATTSFVEGLQLLHTYGLGSTGGRNTLAVYSFLNALPSATSGNYNFVAAEFQNKAMVSAGGTLGAEKGAIFASNPNVWALSGATNLLALTGEEIDVLAQAGSSVSLRFGLSIVDFASGGVQGYNEDVAQIFYGGVAATNWKVGIQFGSCCVNTGGATFPVSSGGTLIKSLAATVLNGIDVSATTFTGSAFKSNGFTVGQSGLTTLTTTGTSGNQGLAVGVTQTQPNSTDTADNAFKLAYTLSASSATNELVDRVFFFSFTNALTGGGAITNGRLFDLSANTNASTTTSNLDGIYIENGTASGTVTQGAAIHIASWQGTAKFGILDQSGGFWQASSLIQTGTTTVGALPACGAGTKAAHFFVTDGNTANAFRGAVTGGGALQQWVVCDGTSWLQG